MTNYRHLSKAILSLAEGGHSDLSEKVLAFIKSRKMTSQIPTVIFYLDKITKEEKDKKAIQIEAAHEIKPEVTSQIKNFLKVDDSTVSLFRIKKELVSGFRVKCGGVVYDSSISSNLKRLEESLTK